jgi:hypothetical protein
MEAPKVVVQKLEQFCIRNVPSLIVCGIMTEMFHASALYLWGHAVA